MALRCLVHRTNRSIAHSLGLFAIIALILINRMFPHTLLDRLLQLRSFEQRRSVWYSRNRLIRFKHFPRHPYVNLFARLQIQPQPSQHDRYQSTRTGPDDKVEVVAWFWNLVSFGRLAFDLDVCPVHELLNDYEHGIASHATSICQVLAGGLARLRMVCLPRERILSGGPLVVSFRLKAPLLLFSIVANEVCTMSSGKSGRLLRLLSAAPPAAKNLRRAVLIFVNVLW